MRPVVSRRRFLLLSAVALIGTACGSTEATGLRGNGTVYVPRDADSAAPAARTSEVEPTPQPSPTLVPLPQPTPEPIVPADVIPIPPTGGTEAEMHVAPVWTG